MYQTHTRQLIDLSDFFGHENDTIHNEEEQNICEGSLTETERLAVLKTMETEKRQAGMGQYQLNLRIKFSEMT